MHTYVRPSDRVNNLEIDEQRKRLIAKQHSIFHKSIKTEAALPSSQPPPQKITRNITMRLLLVAFAAFAATSSVEGFAQSGRVGTWGSSTALKSTVEAVSGAEIKSRMEVQIEKMKAKDASSKSLSKEVSDSLDCENYCGSEFIS